MAKSKSLPWPPLLCGTLLLIVLVVVRPLSGAEPMPNSSRECAICHIRWVDALVRNEPRADLMEAVLERQAGSGDMCLSCHDGSVVDSRFKVWSTRHHTTDSVPSAAVSIPTDKFPLDAQGRMTCATCHTAHAVPDSSDLKTVIFLRQPNVDSALCLSCHPKHAQKNDFQHPLGRGDSPVPQVILEAGGKTSVDGHTVICQTCHEPHGAGDGDVGYPGLGRAPGVMRADGQSDVDRSVHRYLDRRGPVGVLRINDRFPLYAVAGMLWSESVALADEPHPVGKHDAVVV